MRGIPFLDSIWLLKNCPVFGVHYTLLTDSSTGLGFLGKIDNKIADLTLEVLAFKEESMNLLYEINIDVKKSREALNRIEANLAVRISNDPKTTLNVQIPTSKIYGRDDEAKILLQTLCAETPESQTLKFALIVAPSGLGKSTLLAKALSEVTENGTIKSAFQEKVQQILVINCDGNQGLSYLASQFNDLLGIQEGFDDTKQANSFSQHLVQLPNNKVWLILDNFERWLDESYNQ